MFGNIATAVVKKPVEECGVCKRKLDSSDDTWDIERVKSIAGAPPRLTGKKTLHCFECYEDVMDEVLYGERS